jgi:O-antigen/teichoic acid export membrane protein
MHGASLPARILYAVIAFALGGVAGFYAALWEYPILLLRFQGANADLDGFEIFKTSLAIGAGVAFMAFLVALTQPWKRLRRRGGREARIAISGVVVVLASLAFAGLHHRVIYDLAFAVWLSYVIAYTYVRYGVLDSRRSRTAHVEGTSSGDDAD